MAGIIREYYEGLLSSFVDRSLNCAPRLLSPRQGITPHETMLFLQVRFREALLLRL